MTVAAAVSITESDRGWVLTAWRGSTRVGTAHRVGIGGSRGSGWYWLVAIGPKETTARNKPDARAELLRRAQAAITHPVSTLENAS